MVKTIVTISLDDGAKQDLKMMRLLDKYNLKATFYIPKTSLFTNLAKDEIRALADHHEVGGHAYSHEDLAKLNFNSIKWQVDEGKKYLEKVLEKSIKIFCYPQGGYNNMVKEIVRAAGYAAARTTNDMRLDLGQDKYEMPTTLHIYPFPFRKKDAKYYHRSRHIFQPLFKRMFRILAMKLPFNSFYSWKNLAKNLFDRALQNGGVYHLWGHSWEIDHYNMWDELEEIFKYISNQEDVLYLTNSQVYENSNLTR